MKATQKLKTDDRMKTDTEFDGNAVNKHSVA